MPGAVCFQYDADRWFVEWQRTWYLIRSDEDVAMLLQTMPLRAVDGGRTLNLPTGGGYVTLSDLGDTGFLANFRHANGEIVGSERMDYDGIALFDAEWRFGAYPDKWIEPEAEIEITGGQTVQFGLFLPGEDSRGTKRLQIKNRETVLFDQHLPRREGFVTPVFELDKGPAPVVLTFSSTVDQLVANDKRDVALVVYEVKINGRVYEPTL